MLTTETVDGAPVTASLVELMVQYEVSLESRSSRHQRTPLIEFVDCGIAIMTGLHLDHGVNVHATDKYEWTALHTAAFDRENGIISLLISKGAQLAAQGTADEVEATPLHAAAGYGTSQNIRALLEPTRPTSDERKQRRPLGRLSGLEFRLH